jgi:quinol monooxygenase YgiN
MNAGVIVIIEFQTQEGQEAVARRELTALVEEVVAKEPDCHGIEFHVGQDDPSQILLYERWTSKEAYTGPHMETPYIRAFRDRAAAFMSGPPAITFWRLAGDFARR